MRNPRNVCSSGNAKFSGFRGWSHPRNFIPVKIVAIKIYDLLKSSFQYEQVSS